MFVWYIEGDRYLRIASEDKRYCVSLEWEAPVKLRVSGQEFPGLTDTSRPVALVMPRFEWKSIGGLVDAILTWSFDLEQLRQRHAQDLIHA
jgi:hypothetical protein